MTRNPESWARFVSSSTSTERGQAWLGLIAERFPGISASAILIENAQDHTFAPLAVWPQAHASLARLGAVVQKVMQEKRGIIEAQKEVQGTLHVAYPLFQGDSLTGVVALELKGDEAVATALFQELHWGSAWLTNLMAARDLHDALQAREKLGSVLDHLAIALRHGKLQQALFDVANSVRKHFSCVRVAIGFNTGSRIKLQTLSEAATFEKHTSLVKAYERAMDEALDHGKPVQSTPASRKAQPFRNACSELAEISGSECVLAYPLMQGADCLGVLLLEREKEAFTEADMEWLDAFSALTGPVIEQRKKAEYGVYKRARQNLRTVLVKIFGPGHLTWKVLSLGLGLLLAVLVLFPIQYRVSAKTVVEGEVQRVVAAPFEGFLSESHVRAGDIVKADQLLAQLDDRELRIEETRWTSERNQFSNRLREAMANQDLTSMQILSAQLEESQAQLNLITEKIGRSRLRAPFDGVVITGDLSQQVGSPLEKGKKLFEIAPLQSYRIILQVDEREIRHIRMGQKGRLVMTGIAGDPTDFVVAKVTPVATAKDGKNYFRVEATLQQAMPRLRPGMEGVGKIEVGERTLWWVLTRSFTEWLVLSIWTWMP